MSLLVLAMKQAILPPQYHPSYSTEQKDSAGRQKTPLRKEREEKILSIVAKLGSATHADIFFEIKKDDPKVHKDDVRKMANDLVDDRKMDKRNKPGFGNKLFYSVCR